MPMWARVFGLLLGFPLVAALLRVGFEHDFSRSTALILTSIALIEVYLFLHWNFKSRSVAAPRNPEEKKRQTGEDGCRSGSG